MVRKDGLAEGPLRERLSRARGKEFWRSLDELAETEEFKAWLHREFPAGASTWHENASRRHFLKIMAASFALAGLNGCRNQPEEKIVPYVRQPAEITPGRPLYFATATVMNGAATGLLVESHMGRPIKIEGNPRHPASPPSHWGGDEQFRPGACDIHSQSASLNFYDPDRSQTLTYLGEISTWDALLTDLTPQLEQARAQQGAGLRILTESIASPTLTAQIQALLEAMPEARWHSWEPINHDNSRQGAELAFGRVVQPRYRLNQADVILSLDSDFLGMGTSRLVDAREYANRRRVSPDKTGRAMNRLYVIESSVSITGSVADHRLPVRSGEVAILAAAIARQLGVEGSESDDSSLPEATRRWVEAVADDLKNYRPEGGGGASVVLAGPWQPPAVHALAHAMNEALGNIGRSVTFIEPIDEGPANQTRSLADLVADLRADKVETLIILGGNPVYNAPADMRFAQALEQAKFRIHMGLYRDETAERCHWHIPESHFLEAWGDARAFDGTASLVQPLIAPLYNSFTAYELLATLLGQPTQAAYDLVRAYWQRERGEAGFDTFWETSLHEGVIADSAFPEVEVSLQANWAASLRIAAAPGDGTLEAVFRPDPCVWDGRFANNAWLQELPKPLIHLVWDNAACLSPATAERLGLEDGDVVQLEHNRRRITAPILRVPGHPEDSLTLPLGYGRTKAGRVGNDLGFNAYFLRTSQSPWSIAGVKVTKTGGKYRLAQTQLHHLMEGLEERPLVRRGDISEYLEDPEHPHFAHPEHHGELASLYPEFKYDGYKWGMTIDLTTCISCQACVIACQSENNIPVVGKEQVIVGREMHWIRVDTYFAGEPENPEFLHQPVPCMHCEKAPCEVVCPVAATTHDAEGLNTMVYNRCVGTRYCSNNCPYKVRRFNFLQYSDKTTPVLALLNNPDVTVRDLGVMEKCTYCVQRISQARIESEKRGSPIRDGEVVTACQSACPTETIVFGNLNDPKSLVRKMADHPLNYGLLEELGTQPRTTYHAAVRNPNPRLAGHA